MHMYVIYDACSVEFLYENIYTYKVIVMFEVLDLMIGEYYYLKNLLV